MNKNIDFILYSLSKSKFRNSFHLKQKDIDYVNDKGLDKINEHTYDFINKRLKDTSKVNDGKQTPMKGHPVFIAQHATATCCRTCINKWHGIDKNKILDDDEIKYIQEVIMTWIKKKINK